MLTGFAIIALPTGIVTLRVTGAKCQPGARAAAAGNAAGKITTRAAATASNAGVKLE